MKMIILALLGLFSASIAFGQTFGSFKGLPAFNKINDPNLTQLLKNAASTGGVTGGGKAAPPTDFTNQTEADDFFWLHSDIHGNVLTVDTTKIEIKEITLKNGETLNATKILGQNIINGKIKFDLNAIDFLKTHSSDIDLRNFDQGNLRPSCEILFQNLNNKTIKNPVLDSWQQKSALWVDSPVDMNNLFKKQLESRTNYYIPQKFQINFNGGDGGGG